jgi:hypothetical protein
VDRRGKTEAEVMHYTVVHSDRAGNLIAGTPASHRKVNAAAELRG